MLCPSVFPPPASPPMQCFLDAHWPVRRLWPEVQPIFFHMEQEMQRHLQEMRQNMEIMERLHQRIFQQIDHTSPSAVFQPIVFQELWQDGLFSLSLDTVAFHPEELEVTQVGRKLRVSGRSEKKTDDEKGSFSSCCQEFRQELDLPHGVEPEAVRCSLSGGRLQIQAPRERAVHDGKERLVPINVLPAIASPESDSAEKN
ncbi:heat shock protein beta 9-like [Notothenia coriiceps]|uniref:Heat shock protein beta 9-like n=1 Tax=Notothenia coriiceps TaxID=8208 RepID=A0A6I9PIV0_9TELE|nr:PREDICTED: heat shock protein beta-11-like [Notothenia coriiceps]